MELADIDGPLGMRLAIAYRDRLDEQKRLDGAPGPAFCGWQRLLRELKLNR